MNPELEIAHLNGGADSKPVSYTHLDVYKRQSLHGLTRTLIHNMVVGVTEGYTKTLEVNGVGYRDVYKRQPVGRPGPCTPWGKPALGLKTRKKNKQSNKMIVRRRDGRAIK